MPPWLVLDPLQACVYSSSVSIVLHFFCQGHQCISLVSDGTLSEVFSRGYPGPVPFRISTSEYYSTILKFDLTFSEVKTSIYARSLSYPCEGWLIMWQIKMSLRLIFSVMNLMDLHESSYRGVIFVEPHRKRGISLCLMFKTSFI